MALAVVFLLVSAGLPWGSLAQGGADGGRFDIFFAESEITISEGEEAPICILADGFTNSFQEVSVMLNSTYISASREDFIVPPVARLISFTMNMSMDCIIIQAARDNVIETREEVVMFSIMTFGGSSVSLSNPMLTLIIKSDPPMITVPEIVNASAGNAAVVCFTAIFPTGSDATIRLSPGNNDAGIENYDMQSFPRLLSFSSTQSLSQCVRIRTFNTTNSDVVTFSIDVSPVNSSTTSLPALSRNQVTVRLHRLCFDGDIRLVNGSDDSQGRVEVCFGNTFTTPCDISEWTIDDASAVCRLLGFTEPVSTPPSTATFGTGSGPFLPSSIVCNPSSTSFFSCLNTRIFGICHPNHGVNCGCSDNSLRLIGRSPNEGRVEICRNNQWGTVCSQGWDSSDAAVVCRQLNIQSEFPSSILKISDGVISRGTGPIFLSDVQCTGSELNISSCPHSMNITQCSHNMDAGVRCDAPPIFRGCSREQFQCDSDQICLNRSRLCDGVPDCVIASSLMNIIPLDEQNCTQCSDNEIRPLFGGNSPQEGVVEVCFKGRFYRVILSSITIREASVICRQLKLGSAGFPFSSNALLQSDSSGLIHQTSNGTVITCNGNEESLRECSIAVRPSSNFLYFEFAAIQCIEATNCRDGMTRLVPENPIRTGETPREGRLEICYRGVWGSVHDNQWTGLDAAVTCQNLGFNGFAAVPLRSTYYSSDPPFLPVVYDMPQCTQLVTGSILNCSREIIQLGSPPRPLPSLVVKTTASPTAATSSSRTRRQSILPPPFNTGLGSVLSRSAGYPYSSLVGVRCEELVPVGRVQGREQEEFLFRCYYESNCTVDGFGTSSIQDCCNSVSPDGRRGSWYSDPQNRCFGCPPSTPSPSSDVSCAEEGEIRLVIRERSAQEGLLQVCKDGIWNFVCSSLINRQVAQVACRQLGFREFPTVIPQIRSSIPLSGAAQSPIRLDSVSCSGSERNIAMCSGLGQNSTVCSGLIASLTCPRLPNVQFSPPVFTGNLTIDLGRSFLLECLADSRDYPRPNNITVSRNNDQATTAAFNSVTVFSRVTLNDSVTYSCRVSSTAGSRTRSLDIIVRGGTGAITSIGFLRMSSISVQRQPPPGHQRTNTELLEDLVFGALPPAVPGQQIVSCNNASRSSMDVRRRLDRYECIIITRGGSTEANAGAQVAQTAASFIQIALPGVFTNFGTSSVGFCDTNETVYNDMPLEWPETIAGETASIPCPDATGNATRICGTDTIWLAPNVSLCGLAINIVSNALQQLITTDNYNELTNQVMVAIETATNDSSQQNVLLVEGVADYFGNISALVGTESSVSNAPISLAVMRSLSQSVAQLQQWPANLFAANPYSSRVLLSLESIAAQYAQIVPVNETIVVQEDNFVLVAENAPVLVLRETGRVVSFESTALPSSAGSRRLADNQVASISLPPSMFERITDRTQVGIFFALYNKNTLFPVREEMSAASDTTGNSVVGSPVVAATVGPRLSFSNLQTPVQINLRLMVSQDSVIREGSQSCVSWDFNGAGGNGNWSTAGCTTSITCDGIVRCNCTHLTNFAVLVDICSRVDPGRCNNNEVFEKAVSVLTIIGASLSIISLLLTVVTLLAFKRLRGRDTTIYHVQLCVAVFFMLLVFVAGINKVSRVGGCVLVSFLIHYFTLAAIFWMTAEAALMFQKLVLVFRKVTRKIIVVTSIICWVTPLIFVVPPLIADLANGRESSNDLVIDRNNFCFLSNATVFWVTFLVPILLLITCNSIIFGIVIVILIKHTRGNLARKKETVQTKTVVRILVSTAGILFLFGISWIFAALTVTVPAIRLPAQVLFVIFNSLQGFFIFLFFCVLSKESRESWKEVLSCGRYKSSFLNPSLKRGKHSNGEHFSSNGKQKTSTSNYLTKKTNSSSLSHGNSEYSNVHSGFEHDQKYEYSVPKPAGNQQNNSAEYSVVTEPVKEDISAADASPNFYTSLVPATQQGEEKVYTSPSSAGTGTRDGVYVNTVEMKKQDRNYSGTSNERETKFIN